MPAGSILRQMPPSQRVKEFVRIVDLHVDRRVLRGVPPIVLGSTTLKITVRGCSDHFLRQCINGFCRGRLPVEGTVGSGHPSRQSPVDVVCRK